MDNHGVLPLLAGTVPGYPTIDSRILSQERRAKRRQVFEGQVCYVFLRQTHVCEVMANTSCRCMASSTTDSSSFYNGSEIRVCWSRFGREVNVKSLRRD